MGIRKKKSRRPKKGTIEERFVNVKTAFDSLKSTKSLMKAATKEAVSQFRNVIIDINGKNGNVVIDGLSTPFKIGKLLGKGGFGTVFELKGSIGDSIVKIVEFKNNDNYEEWATSVVSEASLLRVFSVANVGPTVPPISIGLSSSGVYATLIMERFDGSFQDLYDDLQDMGVYDKYKKSFEKQIRKLVSSMVKVGIVCVDLKPENMLYKKLDNGKFKIVMTDFDNKFCCAMSDSLARKYLVGQKIEIPENGHWVNINASVLTERLDDGSMCPRKNRKFNGLVTMMYLGMIGNMSGLFKKESKKSRQYMSNPSNKGEVVYNMFKHTWNLYKNSFLK